MDGGEKMGEPRASDGVKIAAALIAWYDVNARDLPWRTAPDTRPDPYAVWLSEVMLQQTGVKAVIPYFEKFLRQWPDVEALAVAPRDEVMSAWAGLGYYSRARNMHKAAGVVAFEMGGCFPPSVEDLQSLPGIGPYTAAAIAAIAFGIPAVVVDANVERVVARVFAVTIPLPRAKGRLHTIVSEIAPQVRPGDFAQAMMDLGATVCAPKRPLCPACPLVAFCAGHGAGLAAILPNRQAKPEKPLRKGAAFFALRDDGAVLLRKRPENGLLGAMMEVPSAGWSEAVGARGRVVTARAAPFAAPWRKMPGTVRHSFTHFHLELAVYGLRLPSGGQPAISDTASQWRWVGRGDLGQQALPSLMRKVITHGLGHLDGEAV